VHRDLKPSNIFLTPHGVKLLDFGLTCGSNSVGDETLVRLTVPAPLSEPRSTQAPEQLRGDPVDARTDLFASGVVLYEIAVRQTAIRRQVRPSKSSIRSCTNSRRC
jgi:serine/threonine protein kinase